MTYTPEQITEFFAKVQEEADPAGNHQETSMSEPYTPSLDELRDDYAYMKADVEYETDRVTAVARFNRAIAAHVADEIEKLADAIVVTHDHHVTDEFDHGFNTGADAVYAALREQAHIKREESK